MLHQQTLNSPASMPRLISWDETLPAEPFDPATCPWFAMLGRMLAGEGVITFAFEGRLTWERGEAACAATLQKLKRVGHVIDDPYGAGLRYRPTKLGRIAYARVLQLHAGAA